LQEQHDGTYQISNESLKYLKAGGYLQTPSEEEDNKAMNMLDDHFEVEAVLQKHHNPKTRAAEYLGQF
jgi:hypothetical protein